VTPDTPWSDDLFLTLIGSVAEGAEVERVHDIEALKSLVRQSGCPSCLVDTGGRIAAWNSSLARLTGIAPDSIEGEPLWDGFGRLLPRGEEGRLEAVEETIIDAVSTGETGWVEHVLSGRMVAAENVRLTVDVRGSALPVDKGYILGLAFFPRAEKTDSGRDGNAALEVLRQLNRRLEVERERERERIARELHDELEHTLTALKMDVARICERFSLEPEAQNGLMRVIGYTDEAIAAVRRISMELRPSILDDLGLSAAIEWQAEEFTQRTGIDVRVNMSPPDLEVTPAYAIEVFRILQEALTNVVRHAEATTVWVTLRATEEHIELIVKDNGQGIDREAANRRSSQGLVGIRERARHLNGMARIKGAPAEGTTVYVRLPLDAAEGRRNHEND